MAPSDNIQQSPRKLESETHSIGRLSNLTQRRLRAAAVMANHTVKLDSVQQFLDELLPRGPNTPECPQYEGNPFESLSEADTKVEIEVQDLFMHAVTSGQLSPRLVMCRSEARPDSLDMDSTRQKVDAAFFRPDVAPDDGRPHWVDQDVPVEFKSRKEGNKLDPFDDRNNLKLESDAAKRKHSRGQIISYAELLLALQPRVFLFMLLIMGRRFRLLRWDRGGVIITASTDYYKHPRLLCDFLWRISHFSPAQLGYDTTATRIPLRPDLTNELDDILAELEPLVVDHNPRDLDEKLPDRYVWKHAFTLFAASLKVKEWPRYKIWMNDKNGKPRCYLVGKPVVDSRGVTGRITRGYAAYDVADRRLVWLKDTWRTWYEGVETEGDVVLRLNGAQIESVPTVVCHGDVGEQTTLTATWWERQHSSRTNESSSLSGSTTTTPDTPIPPLASSPPVHPPISNVGSSDDRGASGLTDSSTNERAREVNPSEDEHAAPVAYNPQFRHDVPIPHHRHYRSVFEEICIELKHFKDARQLVLITLDCIKAHYYAASAPALGIHVLHRDITDSNIMIYPKIQDVNGRPTLVWTGILIDWEMSKPILAPLQARRMACTVCFAGLFFLHRVLMDYSGNMAIYSCSTTSRQSATYRGLG
ncbi:hypothetical protein BD311DRAFT_846743 [Dichomitus squalens]|uniref:Fungal-type protein kinase domain-containing protein n=1 Tax=Dichomitus squalens TaxID=114155 RepID=A0A4Q9MJL6_9APHY|nr:hypothetical protein BD311DRAFT_846743 [Dichomitus squalens]